MEFPGLGEHCSLPSCKRLDFLPMNCDACEKTFCNDHVAYESHRCQSAYKKDVQVPVCPLCNKPIPVKRGEPPDIKVGQHIDQDCESDPAKQKRKLNSNRCSVKGCKKRELVPVVCDSCRKNYCLRHRHPQDHKCSTVITQHSRILSNSVTRQAPKAVTSKSKPQQTSLSVLGRDLDRARRDRTAQSSPGKPVKTSNPQTLSEDEALALAIQASLSESSPQDKTSTSLTQQEEEDRALAQAIADSERLTHESRGQRLTNRGQDDGRLCTIS